MLRVNRYGAGVMRDGIGPMASRDIAEHDALAFLNREFPVNSVSASDNLLMSFEVERLFDIQRWAHGQGTGGGWADVRVIIVDGEWDHFRYVWEGHYKYDLDPVAPLGTSIHTGVFTRHGYFPVSPVQLIYRD